MRTLALMCGLCVWGAAIAQADLYQWTDAQGAIHVVDEASEVPDSYRAGLKVYHAAKTVAPLGLLTAPLSPGRTYAAESQGAFAQKLALDLGLIRNSGESDRQLRKSSAIVAAVARWSRMMVEMA